jgi:hypothetical protein
MEKNAVKICQPKEGHVVLGWAWDSTFACEKRRMGTAREDGSLGTTIYSLWWLAPAN